MAHFAKIGTGNIVLRVHTIHNNEAPTEEAGQEFLRTTHKNKDTYKQTSYNTQGGVHLLGGTPFRKIMLEEIIHLMKLEMLCIPPRPYNSWTLNEDTCRWEAPTSAPEDGKEYEWNESTKSWDEIV